MKRASRTRSAPAWILTAGGCLCLGAATPSPPKIDSISPLGGNPGATLQIAVRGASLQGAYDVWFDGKGMTARVLGVDSEKPGGDSKRKPADILRMELHIEDSISAPGCGFRVLTPGGASNALRVSVIDPPVQAEAEGPHDLPRQAQPLSKVPVAVQGRIAEVGEVDYYSFRVSAGEELLFRTLSSEALDPGLAIYKLAGSWFDADRATRIAVADEPVSYPNLSTQAVLPYRFADAGEYLVRVNGFWGHGGVGQDYTLLITHAGVDSTKRKNPAPAARVWNERKWTRSLTPDRMRLLWARALPSLAEAASPIPIVDADAEPTTAPVEPQKISLPSLVTGAIERPGDIDRVRFSVKEGDRVALEVETPDKTIPLMNPYLRVVDSEGVEAFTNILSVVNSNSNVSKQIHPKTQYSFPRAGDFTLEIRDITATYGDPRMKYRVLVRPQVPHMGEVKVNVDCVNLVAGVAQKVSIVTDQEEGFDGFVILSMEGLPEGVRAVPATEVDPDSPPSTSMGKRERFTTKNQKATLVLASEAGAPLTRTPVMARVYAQPVVKGELGSRVLVKEIPVMVVKGAV